MTLLYWECDSQMTFEKHLCFVFRASLRFGTLRKSWRVFHDRSLLGRCFRGFVLFILEYCSAVLYLVADALLKLLDRAVSDARILTGRMFDCDIAHRRSVAVLCMLCKIMSNKLLTLKWCSTWTVCASTSYSRCSGSTSVNLCAASLLNLAVPQDFHSPLNVPLERSC